MKLLTTTIAAMAITGSAMAFPTYTDEDNVAMVATTNQGNVYYMLGDTVEVRDTMVRVWLHMDARENEEADYYDAKQFIAYDCMLKTMKILSILTYDEAGDVFWRIGAQDTQYIVPGSIGDDIAQYACAFGGMLDDYRD